MNGISDKSIQRILVIVTVCSILFAIFSFVNSRISADDVSKLYTTKEEMESLRFLMDVKFQDIQRSLLQIREGQARLENYIMTEQRRDRR